MLFKGKQNLHNTEENQIIIENAQVMYFIESTGYKDKNNEFTLSDIENEILRIRNRFKLLKPSPNVLDKINVLEVLSYIWYSPLLESKLTTISVISIFLIRYQK